MSNNTLSGKKEKRLFNQIKEQVKDEEAAFRKYLDMATEADSFGMFNLANELRNIAKQEYQHKDTLNEFYLQITEAPEKEALSIPPAYVVITNPGNTIFSVGDAVSYKAFTKENERVRLIGGRPAEGKASER